MINRSRLSYKIFLTASTALLALFGVGAWLSYSLFYSVLTTNLQKDLNTTISNIRQVVETSASLSIRNYLKGMAEHYVGLANDYYIDSLAGDISMDFAKDLLKRHLLSKKIGDSGYIYIINSEGVVISHPKTELINTNIRDQEFVQKQIQEKQGFLEYEWKNPDDLRKRKKILCMDYFKEWDWIISVTAYRDELTQLIRPGDFRDAVLSLRIAEHGYPFVIDLQGNLIIHPTLTGNILDKEPGQRNVFQQLLKQKSGEISYEWPDPKTLVRVKKTLIFDTIDEYGWIVAATGYIDDIYSPLNTVKELYIAIFLGGIFLFIFVSFYLSQLITRPLNTLLKRISHDAASLNINLKPASEKNEIEEISEYFSDYMEQLKSSNKQLLALLEEKQQNAIELSIYKEVFENIAEGITITRPDGAIINANPAFSKITGYSREEAIGQNPSILKSGRHSTSFYEEMWASIKEHGYWSGEIWNRRKSGAIYPEWLTISAVKNAQGKLVHYAAVFNDISDLVEQQQHIEFLAYHDSLTMLPNRLSIRERLTENIAECTRRGEELICLICDIENFKALNDSMGQEFGDTLLIQFVARLKPLLRIEDSLGRLGSDDFIFIMKTDKAAAELAITIVNRIISALEDPVTIDQTTVYLTMNVGISIFPSDGNDAETLIKRANLALDNAATLQCNSYCFFDSQMEQSINNKITYLGKIREALAEDQFEPFYQPKIHLASGNVVGMEALARWRTKSELISPGLFIPVAEQSGLILPISRQIYSKAFADTRELYQMGHRLKLSVNLSPAQFHAREFMQEFLTLHEESSLPTEAVELEVTESILFDNLENVKETLNKLSEIGFHLSIDDFGTGYSSLQYLKQLPLNALKIDRSFVSGIGNDPNDEQLVSTICLMAKQFNLRIIAEGIEDAEQIRFLQALGCDDGQGFLFGRPMAFEEFVQWLEQWDGSVFGS